jgi:DNA sulfur modification protein DndD
MLDNMKSFPKTEINLSKNLLSLQETKLENNEKIKKISKEIEQSNVENIEKWEKERQKYSQEVDQLKIKIALQEKQIERRNNIIRANNIKLNQELKKRKRHSELLKKLAFCDEGITCANKTKDNIMKKVKQEIETRTSQQFSDLIWKKNTYEGVKIDDDYNISVPHVSGREALGTLSAGERQVCALSFMAALNSVSGFEVPLMIDTPLARISREPRKNIAMNLPNYLEGTQVTLLVTEEEYTSEVRNQLSKRVGRTYAIDFFEKERGGLAEVHLTE